jgi:hypothetical protein
MQYNVIPVAAAKNMGLIAMKAFADGALYSKPATWSNRPEHVVRSVGDSTLPSRPLVEYSLSTPGIHTAIIGIGQIEEEPKACQLVQNLSAAQISPGGLSATDRRQIEILTSAVKGGKTNYFQLPKVDLTAPGNPRALQEMKNEKRLARLEWHTALAGDEPILHYEIWRDGQRVKQVAHHPQIDKKPFSFEEPLSDMGAHRYQIASVDAAGRKALTDELALPARG